MVTDAFSHSEGGCIGFAHTVAKAESQLHRSVSTGELLSGRYRLLRRIGAGGMGEVYLATRVADGARVAIKVLAKGFGDDQRQVERFVQEARAASMVRHPNVVEISELGAYTSGRPFFVMELLEGEDLGSTLAREGALPWPRVRAIMLQILAALSAAHARGVIHRDVKPENCFRSTRGANRDFIKVLDFGIAKVIDDQVDRAALTRSGAVIGTAHYMSPEQARSERLDARADIYSAGIIMYQLLTGRVPFRAAGFLGVLAKQITEPPPPMAAVAPTADVPLRVEQIVRRALAKDRGQRFATAADFAAAIRRLPPDLHARSQRRLLRVAIVVGAVALAGGILGARCHIVDRAPEPVNSPTVVAPVLASVRIYADQPEADPPWSASGHVVVALSFRAVALEEEVWSAASLGRSIRPLSRYRSPGEREVVAALAKISRRASAAGLRGVAELGDVGRVWIADPLRLWAAPPQRLRGFSVDRLGPRRSSPAPTVSALG